MALEQGKFEVRITGNSVGTFGDKDAVVIEFETAEGDQGRALIYLTPASMNIARKSLKMCGFDVTKSDLTELLENPKLLAGGKVPVLIEDWKGKLRAQIALNQVPEKKALSGYTAALRKGASAMDDDDIPF